MHGTWEPGFWDGLTENEDPTFMLALTPPVGEACTRPTQIEASKYSVGVWGNVHGTVITPNGSPVWPPGVVIIHQQDGTVGDVDVKDDGSFSLTRAFWVPGSLYIVYRDTLLASDTARYCSSSTWL